MQDLQIGDGTVPLDAPNPPSNSKKGCCWNKKKYRQLKTTPFYISLSIFPHDHLFSSLRLSDPLLVCSFFAFSFCFCKSNRLGSASAVGSSLGPRTRSWCSRNKSKANSFSFVRAVTCQTMTWWTSTCRTRHRVTSARRAAAATRTEPEATKKTHTDVLTSSPLSRPVGQCPQQTKIRFSRSRVFFFCSLYNIIYHLSKTTKRLYFSAFFLDKNHSTKKKTIRYLFNNFNFHSFSSRAISIIQDNNIHAHHHIIHDFRIFRAFFKFKTYSDLRIFLRILDSSKLFQSNFLTPARLN